MYLLFVDESGTPPKPNNDTLTYFVIAGLVVPEERWPGLNAKVNGLKRASGCRGEVKWRYFAPNNRDADNPMSEWDQNRRNEFRDRIFSIIVEAKSCKVIACTSEAPTAFGLPDVATQDDVYFRTYRPLIERFEYLLKDITKTSGRASYGMVIADHRGRGDDDRMRHQHERLIRKDGMNVLRHPSLIEGVFFTPSHLSLGIQLSDMIAGAIWRAVTHADRTWFDAIIPAFRHSPSGFIDGHGLARFPKKGWKGVILERSWDAG
jgi:hypothetical protein